MSRIGLLAFLFLSPFTAAETAGREQRLIEAVSMTAASFMR